jgi:hypothetical protein
MLELRTVTFIYIYIIKSIKNQQIFLYNRNGDFNIYILVGSQFGFIFMIVYTVYSNN